MRRRELKGLSFRVGRGVAGWIRQSNTSPGTDPRSSKFIFSIFHPIGKSFQGRLSAFNRCFFVNYQARKCEEHGMALLMLRGCSQNDSRLPEQRKTLARETYLDLLVHTRWLWSPKTNMGFGRGGERLNPRSHRV